MYLNNVEIKALRNVLVENRYSESAKILRTALARNDKRIQQQRKIINDMMQMPKNNILSI